MAELDHRSDEKDTFDELLNDVNSLLEDGECTPSEILSDRLDLDNSYDLDELNEGDDENSDFEITVVARKQLSTKDDHSPSPTKDAQSSPLHRPVSFTSPSSPSPESPQPGCSATVVVKVSDDFHKPEVSRDSATRDLDDNLASPKSRPTSALQTVDELFFSSSDAIVAPAPSAAATPPSPKQNVLNEMPNFTSTPIPVKPQQQQQQRKRIPKLFQISSLEFSGPPALLPIADEGSDFENHEDVAIDDVTLKPAQVSGSQVPTGGDVVVGPTGPPATNDESVDNDDKSSPVEEDGYCSSVLDGYNDGRVKSDEELLEDNLLYGDLGVNDDDGLVHFDFTDDEFDEISRRLLGEDAEESSIRDEAASPPAKRRKQESSSPIPSSADLDEDDEGEIAGFQVRRDVDRVDGDDNNNEKLVSLNLGAEAEAGVTVSTSKEVEGSLADLVVIDEDNGDDDSADNKTVTDGNESEQSSVICLGSREDGRVDATKEKEDADKSIEVSESESVGILVEDFEEGDVEVVAAAGPSTSGPPQSSASGPPQSSAESDDKSLKRKATDTVVVVREEEAPKGPKIRRVLEVKGKFRWDIFSDSTLVKKRFDRDPGLEEIVLELVCPLGGDRLTDPVRTGDCAHLEVVDRKNLFIFSNVNIGYSDCPLCGIKMVVAEKGGKWNTEQSRVFLEILSNTTANSVTFYRDGTWDPEKGSEEVEEKVVRGDNKSAIAESIIPPEESGPKVIQIYKDGEKKSFKVENEDQMMRLVGEKWNLSSFPKRDKNRTVANFRKRRLLKAGDVLVGRSLLERNESPLYRSNDDDDSARPRPSRKRKRTVEQLHNDKKALVDRFVEGVLERRLEDLDKDFVQGKRRIKSQYDQVVYNCQVAQESEVTTANRQLMMQGATHDRMYAFGLDMRRRHDMQKRSLATEYNVKIRDWEILYRRRRQGMEDEVRQNVTRTTQSGVPGKHKEDITKRGEDVEDIVPAVLCGGNEKIVKTTFLPIDCVEAILKENAAYRKVYGMDDKVLSKPKH